MAMKILQNKMNYLKNCCQNTKNGVSGLKLLRLIVYNFNFKSNTLSDGIKNFVHYLLDLVV